MKISSFALAAMVLLTADPRLQAAEARKIFSIGSVRAVQGKVQRVDGSVLTVGSPLRDGEMVVTGPASSATVVLIDGVALKIGESSQARIGTDTGGRVLDLSQGSVLSAVKPRKTAAPRFRVRTRSATMGVRGTVFYVEESQARKETYVCFCDGKIDLSLAGAKQSRQIVGKHHDQEAWIGPTQAKFTHEMHGHSDAEAEALLHLVE